LLVLTPSPYRWPDLNMALTGAEQECVDKLSSIVYPTAICDIKDYPPEHAFAPEALEQAGLGHVAFITTKDNRENPPEGRRCTVFMNLDPTQKDFSFADGAAGKQVLLDDLRKLGYDKVNILQTKVWKDYNAALPHAAGMKLQSQQGVNRTLYLGSYGPYSFETTAASEQFARETVREYCKNAPTMREQVMTGLSRAYNFFFTLPGTQVCEQEVKAAPPIEMGL
jgi:hypothetical protein